MANMYVICIDEGYTRDTQVCDPTGISDAEFEDFDWGGDEGWRDATYPAYLGTIEAENETEAIAAFAELNGYDPRVLWASKIAREEIYA